MDTNDGCAWIQVYLRSFAVPLTNMDACKWFLDVAAGSFNS